MEQLFLNKPEFGKSAAMRKFLGQDSTTWIKDIITAFLSDYPMLQSEPLTVTWEKTKFEKGFATGKLNIPSVGSTIPIIVTEWVMMPLDVINKQGVFLPLNDYTMGELLTSKNPFKIVHRTPKKELTLFTDGNTLQFSPTGESTPVGTGESINQTRDAIKVGSFIDKITDVNVSDIENLLLEIKEENLQEHFELNDTANILDKLATVKTASAGDEFEALVRDLDLDISFVHEDENGNKFMKQANSQIDYIWETPINDADVDTLKIKAITNEEETFKFASYEELEKVSDNPQPGDWGFFMTAVNDVKTPQVCIVNITKTADVSEKYSTFSCGDGYIAINENKDYYLNDRDTIKIADPNDLAGDNPCIGDYGVWVVENVATKPFEVESIYKSAVPGEYEIVGNRGFSKVGYYPITSKEDELVPLNKRHNSDFEAAFYVPGNARFVKLSRDLSKDVAFTDSHLAVKIANAQNEYGLLKVAGFNATSGKYQFHVVNDTESKGIEKISEYEYDIPVSAGFITIEKQKVETERNILKHVCGRDTAGLYYFSGPEFCKYAESHPIRDLPLDDAIWTLLHCKGSEEDIKKLGVLKYGVEFEASTNLHAPVSVAALASTIENAVESFDDFMPLRRTLVKQASVMRDKSTVDAMLSLGLINKRNMMEYVSMIPNYEVTLSQLSELLLMTRMGLSGVNETALEDTIESMSQVVKGLKEIESVTTLK
ncbi:hypothetical protein LCGC14_1211700 [marine sediment metagenome]|uniref:Uncharacterized protein n=1 Tax=marine sediment metagenome TaxID=412755 RepID=A0A0F9LDR0_9ZZZZ